MKKRSQKLSLEITTVRKLSDSMRDRELAAVAAGYLPGLSANCYTRSTQDTGGCP